MWGRGCHLVYPGIKKQWRKGADMQSNKENAKGGGRGLQLQWRCLEYNDLSKALSYLHFKLIFSYSAFYSLPLVCPSCQHISLIYRFLPFAPLTPHIPALTTNSQLRQAKKPLTVEAAFILIMPLQKKRKRLSARITFFQDFEKLSHQSEMSAGVANI